MLKKRGIIMQYAGGQPQADNTTLEYTSQGKLRLKDGGVTTAKILDANVTTAKLKTATSEQSSAANANIAVTGGSYCFYPQVKASSAENQSRKIWVENVGNLGTSYATYVGITVTGATGYAQFRYVTASGQDHWLFVLIDKASKEIISSSSAPDHVCFGNGNDPLKLVHPFLNFDQAKHEIILVDYDDTKTIIENANSAELSILEFLNKNLKINTGKTSIYKPLHTGHFDAEKKPVLLGQLDPIITVRNIQDLTAAEKTARQQKELDAIADHFAKKQALDVKLKNLGLTDEEIIILKKG